MCRSNDMGNTTSFLYKILHGELPIDLLDVILSAHITDLSFVCQVL